MAALQGIAKMRALMALGLPQGVLPPQERPDISFLRGLGFSGTDKAVWTAAFAAEPVLARQAISASAMWAANAATVSPSPDCADGRLHLSVANLSTMTHRSLEAPQTLAALKAICPDPTHFEVHAPLHAQASFTDEGAANFMRLCETHGAKGVEIFVYGRDGADGLSPGFPARQTLESVHALARRHGLDPAHTHFARQSRTAIDAGAFHNDVVAVASERVMFFHEHAFADKAELLATLRAKAKGLLEPEFVEVPDADVPLKDAIKSYLFNAQLVRRPGAARMTLVLPEEARANAATHRYLQGLVAGNGPIGELVFLDVRESMRNGGGPACLRLRIAMTPAQRAAASQGFFLTDALATRLESWVRQHYRETLAPADLVDPALIDEVRSALDALTQILPLGSGFYPFQRG
jgi:succinylarginine dihydrolase